MVCRLATETARTLLPLAKVAAVIVERELWRSAGYSSLHDFTRERLERSSRWLRNHAALHRAVAQLPALRAAVTGERGEAPIGVCRALLVARVATSETVDRWVTDARRLTVDELSQAVREQKPSSDAAAAISSDDSVESHSYSIASEDIVQAPRVLWSMSAPPAVRAAFDSALDLYRRVEGADAPVESFVEALVAEAFAGPNPPDVSQVWLQTQEVSPDLTRIVTGLALPALSEAREVLQAIDVAIASAGAGSDDDVLRQLQCLTSSADVIERHLASVLIEMCDNGLICALGLRSIGAYAEDRLGLCRTTVEDRVRAARAIASQPQLWQAYATGQIGLEKTLLAAQILGGKIVDAALQSDWANHLAACTVKRLRDEKRALLWNSAVEGCGGPPLPMTDEQWLASLRCAPGDTAAAVQRAGRAACENKSLLPVSGSALRLRLPAELGNHFTACIESQRVLMALKADALDWPFPISNATPASWRAARTFSTASRRVPSWVGLLALLEDFCAQHDHAATRSACHSEEFARARHRCEAPGCTNRKVESHHRVYRSHGGSDHPFNRDALCAVHHRHGQHGGLMHVAGDSPIQRLWRLGPKGLASGAVWFRNERHVDPADYK